MRGSADRQPWRRSHVPSGEPLRLALLGMPVSHSRSPRIHRAALVVCGIAGAYEAREVGAEGFADACRELRNGALDGANVTMPHKERAFRACAVVDADATLAGAVNTLANRGGALVGWNTDVAALRTALVPFGEHEVLILGAGGAAAAAVVASIGARPIRVAARSRDDADALAKRIGGAVNVEAWGAPLAGAIVVNATPLGMRGETLPGGVLEAAAGLVDLAYGPEETPAMAFARSQGLPAIDGITLLVAQAAASFEIWTGVPAPKDVMERAARDTETLKPS